MSYQKILTNAFTYRATMNRVEAMRTCAMVLGMGSYAMTTNGRPDSFDIWLSTGTYNTLIELSPIYQTYFKRTVPHVEDS